MLTATAVLPFPTGRAHFDLPLVAVTNSSLHPGWPVTSFFLEMLFYALSDPAEEGPPSRFSISKMYPELQKRKKGRT